MTSLQWADWLEAHPEEYARICQENRTREEGWETPRTRFCAPDKGVERLLMDIVDEEEEC